MASIFDRYGIKEVADVTFYKINDDGTKGAPVLYLDTLKVSTIEQTASSADAKGGKGNPILVSWDFGREITVNLEDALFSPASMAVMFGDKDGAGTEASRTVEKVAMCRVAETPANTMVTIDSKEGKKSVKVMGTEGTAFNTEANITKVTDKDGKEVTASNFGSQTAGEKLFVHYTQTGAAKTIDISAESFPGTYYITGDTYCRSDVTGEDSFFQFVIPKAKVQSENTITLEAEGDPSVFNMSLKVMRPESSPMMSLIQYDLT